MLCRKCISCFQLKGHLTYHEGIVERSEDVRNGEVLITVSNLVLEGGNLLDGLLFLSGCLSLNITSGVISLVQRINSR